jgi:hypothetical protein
MKLGITSWKKPLKVGRQCGMARQNGSDTWQYNVQIQWEQIPHATPQPHNTCTVAPHHLQNSDFAPSTQCRVRSAIIKVPRLEIIPPIRRERNRFSTCTLHCKSRNKYQQLRSSTDGRTQNIIILQEPFRVASADVELHVEAETEGDHDGGVDAH